MKCFHAHPLPCLQPTSLLLPQLISLPPPHLTPLPLLHSPSPPLIYPTSLPLSFLSTSLLSLHPSSLLCLQPTSLPVPYPTSLPPFLSPPLILTAPPPLSLPALPLPRHRPLLRLSCLFSTHSLSLQQQLVTPMPVSSLFSQQFSHHLHHSTHYSFFSAPTLPYTFSHFHSLPCSFLFCSFLTLLSGGGRGDQREVRSPGPHPYPPGRQSIHDRTLYRACGAFTSLFHTITILGLLHSHYPLHTTAAATALLALLTPPQQPQQQLRRQRGTYLNRVLQSYSGRGPMNPVASP